MARHKTVIVATLAVLGLLAAPVQAFGPMMLLMMPVMMGGHQHGGGTRHGDSKAGHADAPQAPVGSTHEQSSNDERSPSDPPVVPQPADSRDDHRSDTEHGR
jgi:hypothetical protein